MFTFQEYGKAGVDRYTNYFQVLVLIHSADGQQ